MLAGRAGARAGARDGARDGERDGEGLLVGLEKNDLVFFLLLPPLDLPNPNRPKPSHDATIITNKNSNTHVFDENFILQQFYAFKVSAYATQSIQFYAFVAYKCV